MGSSPSLAVEEQQQVCQNVKQERVDNNVACNKNGVFLTWKDLWVTVSGGKEGGKSILQGLTGYASPGHVLAIMGPSGCGKSTLLDALSGKTCFFFQDLIFLLFFSRSCSCSCSIASDELLA